MNALAVVPDCTLVARPHPFDSDTVFARVAAGQTLAQMIGPDVSHSLGVQIGGHDIPRALWAHTRPKPGQTVHVTSYPQGGNAGKWVRLVLLVVLTYFTAGIASGAYGTVLGVSSASGLAALGAGLMLVGTLALTPMICDAREIHA